MFLVYINHMEIYYGVDIPLAERLYRPFFVNLFFIISGYLLFRKYFSDPYRGMPNGEWNKVVTKEYLPNTFYKLILPTILFSLINYFPKKIIRAESISIGTTIFDVFGGGCLWFTSALVIAQIIICVLLYRRTFSVKFYSSVSIILLVIANCLSAGDILICGSSSFPWFYKSGFIAVFLMTIGAMYWQYEEKISSFFQSNKFLLGVLLILYVILVVFTDLVVCDTFGGNMNLWGVIATVFVSLILIEGFKSLKPESKQISFIARNSIGFYFLSGAIPNILAVVANKVSPQSNVVILIFLIGIAFIIAYMFVKIVFKYLPFMFDLRKLKK